LNVDAISIVYAYKAPSPHPSRCATCQPIIATAGARSAGIGVRLPVHDTLWSFNRGMLTSVLPGCQPSDSSKSNQRFI